MTRFLAGAQGIVMPAESMSEKPKDQQKSLSCRKCHVTYTNLHSWQREKGEKCRHKIQSDMDIMQHMHLFFLPKHMVTKTAGRILWYLDYDFN